MYAGGTFRFRLSGAGTLTAGGYTFANANVKFSNFPEDAGLAVDVSLSAGSTLTAKGKLNIDANGRFSLAANAKLNLCAVTVDGNVSFANYTQSCTTTWSYFTLPGLPTWLRIPSNPQTSETTFNSGTLSLLVVKGYAEISYYMGFTISSNSPFLEVDGAGSAAIKYQYWTFWDGWSSWSTLASVGVSLQTDPFQACAYASVAGSNVGGCIP